MGMGFAIYFPLILAIVISAGIFLGLKAFLSKSSKVLLNASKGGICIQCGHKADDCEC